MSGQYENASPSELPWYDPSTLITRSRPDAARMIRQASIVASDPEFLKRHSGRPNRSARSSATTTVSSTGIAKCVPSATRSLTDSTTFGCAWPTTIAP